MIDARSGSRRNEIPAALRPGLLRCRIHISDYKENQKFEVQRRTDFLITENITVARPPAMLPES